VNPDPVPRVQFENGEGFAGHCSKKLFKKLFIDWLERLKFIGKNTNKIIGINHVWEQKMICWVVFGENKRERGRL
jgi:hypothetical protein